ncbi:hypothetical protein LJC28_01320 [Dysgonomonas sp. OttesenSCG-928-D17]|nr:hypothetical protein [Dysgonomonas sp. OttesenSCG-928-D17]
MKFPLRKIILLYYLILHVIPCVIAQDVECGLKFRSYEVEKEKRTSLNLTPDAPISLPESYHLSFDLKIDSAALYPFGYVFRIINKEGKHIDFLLNEKKNTGEAKFLIAHSSGEIFSETFKEAGIRYSKWMHIDIHIDTKTSALTALIGDKSYNKKIELSNDFRHVSIIFGKNNYPGFEVIDIPTISLKNIEIINENKEPLYCWLLSKYASDGVYDEIKHHKATCENPNWIINQHIFWQKQTSFTTKLRPMINYNPDDNEVAVYDQTYFIKYNLNSNTVDRKKVNNPVPYIVQSNNLIYNPILKKYVSYTFELEQEKDVLLYDTLKNEWDISSNIKLPPDFWHHNRFISDKENSLYLFGGYGHHKYKNDLRIYDFATRTWKRTQLKGDNPQPRYLSGLGKLDDGHVLIFGGYGNQTGNQELSPQYFYDLYEIDVETLQSKKLWTLQPPANNFVVANSIVVDAANRSFYALSHPSQQFHTKMALLKFSLDKPEYEVLGDSIPVNFEDNKSYADLYLDKQKNRLIAVTSELSKIGDTLNTVSVYTLSFPPLSKEELYQEDNTESGNTLLYIGGFILTALLTFIFMYAYTHYSRKKRIYREEDKQLQEYNNIVVKPISQKKRSKSITLFGGFCVIDKDGNDVTKEFTPMLKQLFVLILLYTFKGGKGISSVKLKDTLWFDKTEESAKNNRGVSLSKLRLIFDLVGQINIKSSNSYWTVELGDDVYCDYSQALYLIDKLSKNKEVDTNDIVKLLSIVSVGELLPNLQVEWVDPFKADFSNTLVDLLLDLSKKAEIRSNPQVSIDLADTIFIHDSLNEDALRLKCSVLVEMGRNGLAQKAYAAFTKEYNILFGTEFEYSFDQIINENS